jgi:hypothetical protein
MYVHCHLMVELNDAHLHQVLISNQFDLVVLIHDKRHSYFDKG